MGKMIHQSAFTILVPIRKDKLKALKQYFKLKEGKEILPFSKMPDVHFCRMFIIDQLRDVKDELIHPAQLVFSSNFDGDVTSQIRILEREASTELDHIYGHCEGYPDERNRKTSTRIQFFHANNKGTNLFWTADIGGTVGIIKQEKQLRNFIETTVNENQIAWKDYNAEEVRDRLKEKIKESSYKWALKARPKASFSYKFKRVVILLWKLSILIFIGIGILLPCLPLILIIGRILEKRAQKKLKKHPRKSRDFTNVLSSEDLQYQNQLTIYGTIDKPYWFRKNLLQIGLWLFRFNGGYRATKGVLSGITTIHFARWVLFNNNNNIMFLSNYDGGWESYLGEFIDNAADAMNLTFGQTYGYPAIRWLIGGGAHDEQVFKYVVRQNQYPCEFFYTAYPSLTMKNIINNKEIRAGLSTDLKGGKLDEWLHRI